MSDVITQSEPDFSKADADAARSLLDQLLSDSRLYTRSKDYKDLLDFVVKLRNFAPFNAMLLQVQKPGLSYAASAHDWRERFRRNPKEGARPLLILWPFGPVALVYDVLDTEGEDLPQDVSAFFAQGVIDEGRICSLIPILGRKCIDWCWVDGGDNSAGAIRLVSRPAAPKQPARYRIMMNKNHPPATQFTTLAHELGHLFLGHLGADESLSISARNTLGHLQKELEAESVAYLVARRNGVTPKSETYLSHYAKENVTIDNIDVYQVMRAAGRIETLLGLTAHTTFAGIERRG